MSLLKNLSCKIRSYERVLSLRGSFVATYGSEVVNQVVHSVFSGILCPFHSKYGHKIVNIVHCIHVVQLGSCSVAVVNFVSTITADEYDE
jgi:hypothetical protein